MTYAEQLKIIRPLQREQQVEAEDMNQRFLVIEQGLNNPNLLINGDFSVWQRGQPRTNTQGVEYIADRWAIWTSSTGNVFSMNNNGVIWDCKGNCNLLQLIENSKRLINKEVTLSLQIKCTKAASVSLQLKTGITGGTVISAVNISGNENWQNIKLTANIGNIETNQFVAVNVYSNEVQMLELKNIKLEEGKIATKFMFKTYSQELLDCQRYYVNLNNLITRADVVATNLLDFNIFLPVKLRVVPIVLGVEGVSWRIRSFSYGPVITGFSLALYSSGDNTLLFQIVKNSHGMTDAILEISGGSGIWVDAEIY